MLVVNLSTGSDIYTANAYLCSSLTSDDEKSQSEKEGCPCHSRLLIDTGCDPKILIKLKEMSAHTGCQPFSDLILTHSHYDHSRMLGEIKAVWNVKTYAYSAYLHGIDHVVKGGEQITLDDRYTIEMIHVPGHSSDSICIYCPEDKILFSGDTPLAIWGIEGTYELPFLHGFEILSRRKISTIYPGHGEPITGDCNRILDQSLHNLRKSRII